jgi:hypothetical protein
LHLFSQTDTRADGALLLPISKLIVWHTWNFATHGVLKTNVIIQNTSSQRNKWRQN